VKMWVTPAPNNSQPDCLLLDIAVLYVWYPSGSQKASSTMISTVVERTLHPHPHLAPPLSTYHITLLYTQLLPLSNACQKNTPADSSNLQGCQTWGCFWVFAAGYSVANPKWEAHSLSSVVLPKPAGAETSVSLRVTPSFSRSVRRGRETNSGRARGT